MNLSMMRDIDRADPIGGLGPRVTPAPTPAPAPVRRPDGIVVDSDGKMSTDLPLPPPEPSWPFPTGTADSMNADIKRAVEILGRNIAADIKTIDERIEPEPGAHGFMRIRVLGAFPWRLAEGTVLAVEPYAHGDGWTPIEGQRGYLLFWFPSEEEGNWWERVA